jgi:hypothetical protein
MTTIRHKLGEINSESPANADSIRRIGTEEMADKVALHLPA